MLALLSPAPALGPSLPALPLSPDLKTIAKAFLCNRDEVGVEEALLFRRHHAGGERGCCCWTNQVLTFTITWACCPQAGFVASLSLASFICELRINHTFQCGSDYLNNVCRAPPGIGHFTKQGATCSVSFLLPPGALGLAHPYPHVAIADPPLSDPIPGPRWSPVARL